MQRQVIVRNSFGKQKAVRENRKTAYNIKERWGEGEVKQLNSNKDEKKVIVLTV